MSEDTYKVLPAIIILSSLLVCCAFSVVCVAKYGFPSFPSFSNFPHFSFRRQENTSQRPYTTENALRYLQSRTEISNRPLIQTPEILPSPRPSQSPIRLQPIEYSTDTLTELPVEIIYPEVPK